MRAGARGRRGRRPVTGARPATRRCARHGRRQRRARDPGAARRRRGGAPRPPLQGAPRRPPRRPRGGHGRGDAAADQHQREQSERRRRGRGARAPRRARLRLRLRFRFRFGVAARVAAHRFGEAGRVEEVRPRPRQVVQDDDRHPGAPREGAIVAHQQHFGLLQVLLRLRSDIFVFQRLPLFPLPRLTNAEKPIFRRANELMAAMSHRRRANQSFTKAFENAGVAIFEKNICKFYLIIQHVLM